MRIFFATIFFVHGLIHIMGFVKAFHLAEINQLTQNISKPVGLFWLVAAITLVATALLYSFEYEWWWVIGAAAIVLSQVLIIISWSDAWYGTIVNVIMLIPIVMAFANSLPTSYKSRFESEVKEGLERYSKPEILIEDDIRNLPAAVRKYIVYSGAVGKEKVQNFRAVFRGQIKPKPDSDFLDFHAVQYNFFDEPKRVFYIESKMFGIPFDGLHLYKQARATMQIKIASLFQVADAKGPEMNQSETVTMLNDMCFLAPATLIDKKIEWETVDSLSVRARFTNQGNSITAILFFNEAGELINFSSDDRYESADGKTYKNYEWTTPLKNYRDFNERKVASYGEAIWHKPQGEVCYGKFNLVEIEYNCRKFRDF